jgi:peptide/nickel transport system permease protein
MGATHDALERAGAEAPARRGVVVSSVAKTFVVRLAQAILTLFAVSIIVFGASRLSGDPAQLIIHDGGGGDRELAQIREALGLDAPLTTQYWHFITNALQGDLGTSYAQQEPALQLILERLPATLELAGAALLVILVLGIGTGLVSAAWPRRVPDMLSTSWNALALALPTFWLGPLLILLFVFTFPIFPAFGRGGLDHLVLPALTLGLLPAAHVGRIVRSEMLEQLASDHVLTARAKGVPERRILLKHGLRPALVPVVTLLGTLIGVLLGGAVITETIFAWPGIGQLLVQALGRRDFPLVQAIALFVAVCFVTINLLVDLSYRFLDPRIKGGV